MELAKLSDHGIEIYRDCKGYMQFFYDTKRFEVRYFGDDCWLHEDTGCTFFGEELEFIR